MAVIHFPEKYRQSLLEGFAKASETDSLFSHELDTEFSGVRTVHVTNLKTYPLQDYDRTVRVGAGSRYGETSEVGDEVQTFEMTQDRALSLSVDKGNNAEQFNMKKAGAIMKAEREEHIIPEIDRYRMEQWAKGAGVHYALPAAPSKENIVGEIIKMHNDMLDAGVPDKVVLVINRKYLPMLKLSSEWVGLDSLGGKTLPKGTLGEFDGMAVKPMSSARFPKDAAWMLIFKGSVISPMKIKDFKAHTDPPGLSGDLLEFRMIYDAFVLGKKAGGVAVACLPGTVAADPVITLKSGSATVTCATAGADVYYTLDGSDPRYNPEAMAYSAAVTVGAGETLKAYAAKEGLWNSGVAEAAAV